MKEQLTKHCEGKISKGYKGRKEEYRLQGKEERITKGCEGKEEKQLKAMKERRKS